MKHSEADLHDKASCDKEKSIMIRKWVHCITFVAVTAMGLILSTTQSMGQSPKGEPQKEGSLVCNIVIIDPAPGTPVGGGGTVSGTAKIPTNSHLWILAHK